MQTLIVLPGLDGTGTLHGAFFDALRPLLPKAARVIAYPSDAVLSYLQLEQLARAALPLSEPFLLLGESFSGPIALRIAADPPPNLVGLVLSTTFANKPLPLARLLAWLARITPVRAIPSHVFSYFLLGRWSTTVLRKALQRALSDAGPSVLRARARAALEIDVTASLGNISVPTLALHASEDRLLGRSALRKLVKIRGIRVVTIAGPHLLLQSAPDACAEAIAEFATQFDGR
jgi:pimeloyl-[acyl-carrier protein] methyl ester esterase